MSKNKYGQYFTPELIADFMVSLSEKNQDHWILEPSVGKGVFLESLMKKGFRNMISYEVDKTLKHPSEFDIRYESFISAKPERQFDLIIGNPPYIRWKNLEEELRNELESNDLWVKYFNSLCDYLYIFILKSITLLKDEGELIFICPDYWLQTTYSESLRNYMMREGGFESVFRFNETQVFPGVNSSLMIFKYKKTKKPLERFELWEVNDRKISVEEAIELFKSKNNKIRCEVPQFREGKRWILGSKEEIKLVLEYERACEKNDKALDLFGNSDSDYNTIGDYFDVANGMVSGLDKAFKYEIGTNSLTTYEQESLINVIKGKNIIPYKGSASTNYFLLNHVESESLLRANYPYAFEKLNALKDALNERYDYGRTIPFWHWVFLRNSTFFEANKSKIFVPVKNRISKNKFFKFSIVDSGNFASQDVVGIAPRKDLRESLEYTCALLNSQYVYQWVLKKGVVKGNIVEFVSAPLKSIPFRTINWSDETEVQIHDEITSLVKNYDGQDHFSLSKKINALLIKLFDQNEPIT